MIGRIFGLIAALYAACDDLVTTLQALQDPKTWRAMADAPQEPGCAKEVAAASRGPP